MSLLLEARKKAQEALAASSGTGRANSELSLEPVTNTRAALTAPSDQDRARSTGQNLFRAKLPPSSLSRPAINRGLVYGLGGTVALLAAGSGYVWYATQDGNELPLQQAISRPAPINQIAPEVTPTITPEPQIVETEKNKETANNVAAIPAINKAQNSSVGASLLAKRNREQARSHNAASESNGNTQSATTASTSPAHPIRIEPQTAGGSLDALLNRAYAAYRDGKLDEARQLYRDMLGKDAQNSDALLGLAAIAQQRGEDRTAAQYYLRVLNLDPRNAVANAGMSALSNNENYESRLKTLLREQGNSAALHFALGNLFAEQSRWGEAQQAYFNAYTLDTKNADLAFNLAVSLDHLGQGKLAAQHYQQALQLDQSRSANFDHAKISRRIDELLR